MTPLEERLGYAFRDQSLLGLALTSPAYRMDHPDAQDNQRLEFLGDAVIGLLSADLLFRKCPQDGEGMLTVRRTKMVSGNALAHVAEKLGVRAFLKRNANAPEMPFAAKPLADAMEAILGAVWLDGGLKAAGSVFRSLGLDGDLGGDEWSGNPKGQLQVMTQGMKPPVTPRYTLVSRSGPSHAPEFTVRVSVDGVGEAEATVAGSLKAAESAAALKMIDEIKEM